MFDFSLLQGYMLCVNDSFRRLPNANAACSLDTRWISTRRHELNQYPGEKFLCLRKGAEPYTIDNTEWMEIRSEPGLSLEWPIVHGRVTSGYVALNVAVLLGASRIALLGYDYNPQGGHWFQEYEWGASRGAQWQTWGAEFDTMIPQVESLGIEIVNFNPQSSIAAFSKRPLSDLRRWYD